MERIDLTPEQILAQNGADLFVVLLESSPDHPLTGLAKRLDWRLGGALTTALRLGRNLAPSDCIYVPVQKPMAEGAPLLLRFFFVPGGSLFPAAFDQLKRNVKLGGFKKVAFSQSDLGKNSESISKHPFGNGVEVCLTH